MSQTTRTDAITISRASVRRLGVGILVLLVLLAVALGIAALLRSQSTPDTLASAINPGEYQYVYLTNGESYFGKLTAPGGGYYYMRHVYTLTAQASPRTGAPLQHSLFKLTSEVHGPEDLLVISRRQVVYMENLSPNGCGAQLLRGATKCT
jgi:hypothetical protein